jgi:Periplasmic protein TonB, links inner and outer membranes
VFEPQPEVFEAPQPRPRRLKTKYKKKKKSGTIQTPPEAASAPSPEPTPMEDPAAEEPVPEPAASPEPAPMENPIPEQHVAEQSVIEDHAVEEICEPLDESCFYIQVSAKHLIFATPVFKRILTGGWKESITYLRKGSVEITAEGWDIEALLCVLHAIHGKYYDVPRKLTLEMLAKVAAIADYYECREVCVPHWQKPGSTVWRKGFLGHILGI